MCTWSAGSGGGKMGNHTRWLRSCRRSKVHQLTKSIGSRLLVVRSGKLNHSITLSGLRNCSTSTWSMFGVIPFGEGWQKYQQTTNGYGCPRYQLFIGDGI